MKNLTALFFFGLWNGFIFYFLTIFWGLQVSFVSFFLMLFLLVNDSRILQSLYIHLKLILIFVSQIDVCSLTHIHTRTHIQLSLSFTFWTRLCIQKWIGRAISRTYTNTTPNIEFLFWIIIKIYLLSHFDPEKANIYGSNIPMKDLFFLFRYFWWWSKRL